MLLDFVLLALSCNQVVWWWLTVVVAGGGGVSLSDAARCLCLACLAVHRVLVNTSRPVVVEWQR